MPRGGAQQMTKRNELHHICRIERGGTRCWDVRVRRKHQTAAHQIFSDSKYGGKAAALRAAIRFRDSVLSDSAEHTYNLWRCKTIKRRDNTSGITGVGRYVVTSRRNGGVSVSNLWIAHWCDAYGKRRSRAFSVERFGERRAKQLACETREAAIREVFSKAKENE